MTHRPDSDPRPVEPNGGPTPAPVRWTPRQRAMLRELGLRGVLPPAGWGTATGGPDAKGVEAAQAAQRVPLSSRFPTPAPIPGPAPSSPAPVDAAIDPHPVAAFPAVARPSARSADAQPFPTTAAVESRDPGSAPPTPSPARGLPDDWAPLARAAAECTACRLCEGRTQVVFGTGRTDAHWMVVGEAPGEQEDHRGEPFVGKSGQLLDAMLASIGLTRSAEAPPEQAVYIANAIKCRPPGNRNPQPDEMAACEPWLQRQIALLRPRRVLLMGRFAVQALLRTDEPIGRLRGRPHALAGVPAVVTYHPAYLLRNPEEKARAWDDLCRLRAGIGFEGLAAAPSAAAPDTARAAPHPQVPFDGASDGASEGPSEG